MSIKIGVISLGCSKNLVDTEIILGNLARYGFQIVNAAQDADVIIVNTCGFIDTAKQEAVNTILEMSEYRTKGKCQALIVIGCLVERYKEDIMKEIPEVDAIVRIKDYSEIIEIIKGLLRIKKYEKNILLVDDYINRLRSTPPSVAYLKIAEGCDNRCAYCVIPVIRGPYVSRKMEDILNEAYHLSKQGVKELTVIAQDTTRYGIDIYGEYKLAELLKKLCGVSGIQWIRLMYAYPESVTDELIDVIADEKKICKYIDLPIQHINDRVLKTMNRRSTGKQIRELITKLRNKVPGITLRTSLIVGFPGETEEEFNELYEFIKEAKFERLGAFAYSREEGTPAASLKEQLPYKTKKSRHSSIMKAQNQISKALNEQFIGQNIDVLIEGTTTKGSYFGRTYRDAPEIDGFVYIKTKKVLVPGEIQTVKINKATEYDLFGGVE
ncbi:MAG: 30S ribosomal protein S12 methylthiotransferase RimO [Deltaproteobacteria bacterium]